jgi:Probable transposase.
MKNDKREESRVLLENYKHLLQKALDWLWERIKVERKEVKGKKVITKITLPEKKGVYRTLRDELEEVNVLASHYVDKAINDAYSVLKGWRRRAEKGRALRKPELKRVYVRVKSTLRKVDDESVRITVRPYQYITFSWSHTWFSPRVKGLELSEPVIKEDKVHLPFRYRLPWSTPLDYLAIDSNLYTLDAYDGEKFVTFSLRELYSLKFGIQLKRGRIQSVASSAVGKGKSCEEVLPPRKESRPGLRSQVRQRATGDVPRDYVRR